MSTVKAHLLSEKNSSQSTVRSTGSDLLDDVLRVLLWIAPWYTCLSTLFFAWLTVLYPRPTLACSISAWLFWFTSMRNINHNQGASLSSENEEEAKNVSHEHASEPANPTTEPEEQTVHIDSDMDDETFGQGAPGYQLLHGKWGHGRTPSMDLHSSSDPSSHKQKKKTQRSDSIGEESHEEKAPITEDGLQKASRLSISKIVTDHLIRKDDYPVETSQKINQGPIFVKSSNGPTLLDAYLEPVHNLYRYSQMSNTFFFSYLPLVTAIFILFLPTQALFIFLSSVVLAWHSPPMKAVSLAIARISVFSSLSDKFVFGKIENKEEEEEDALDEPPSIPGDASERESKDGGATTSLLKVFKKGTAPIKQEGTLNEVNVNENVTEKSLHLVEHQRYWVGVGWLNRTLPTDHPNFTSSDRNVPVAEPTAQFLPPDGIAWIDDKWSIGPWTYTDTFWRQPSLTQYKTAFTRFREWKRRYRTLPEEAVPVPSVSDTVSSEKKIDDEQVANSDGTNHTRGTSKSQSKAAANLKTIMNENSSDTKPRSSSISTTR